MLVKDPTHLEVFLEVSLGTEDDPVAGPALVHDVLGVVLLLHQRVLLTRRIVLNLIC